MSDGLSWFRKPGDGQPGTLNAVFQLLDRNIVAGHSDAPVLLDGATAVAHMTLLEEVSGVAGVLRGLGAEPGTPVACRLAPGRQGVTALLAIARLGAVLDDDADLVADEDGITDADGTVDWPLVRRAGRTDPAPAAELSADAPWTSRRTTLDLALALRAVEAPVTADDLDRVLRG